MCDPARCAVCNLQLVLEALQRAFAAGLLTLGCAQAVCAARTTSGGPAAAPPSRSRPSRIVYTCNSSHSCKAPDVRLHLRSYRCVSMAGVRQRLFHFDFSSLLCCLADCGKFDSCTVFSFYIRLVICHFDVYTIIMQSFGC